jgi:hypothetical protein
MLLSLVVSVNAEIPEFDGGYIQLKNKKYVEITTYKQEGLMGCGCNRYSCLSPAASGVKPYKIKSKDFRGLMIVGPSSDMKNFSLHQAVFNSEGNGCPNKFAKLKIKSKRLNNNAKLFVPSDGLKKGQYAGWINSNLWFFEIQ